VFTGSVKAAEFSDFRGKTSLAKEDFLSFLVILICLSGTQTLKFFYAIEERIPSIRRSGYAYVPGTYRWCLGSGMAGFWHHSRADREYVRLVLSLL
jgi:hypothetical protein